MLVHKNPSQRFKPCGADILNIGSGVPSCFISLTGREIQITSSLRRRTTATGSSGLTTPQLVHHLNELLHSAITEGSRKTTYVDFSSEFCESHASLLPVSVNNLALFISYLSARKFASSTISTYVSALGYAHKLANFPDPTKNFLVQKILAAHSKLYSAPDVRLPITRGVLQRLVLALNHTNSSAYQRLLFQTMFLVAFYGFFRVGELTAKGANLKPLVQIQNLHFQFKDNCVTTATIALCTNDVTKFRPPSRLRQTKSNSVREVGEMYANGE